MGLIPKLAGRRVYLDTNILIYLLEGSSQFEKPLLQIKQLIEYRTAEFVVSSLVFAEVLPPLAASGNRTRVNNALEFLSATGAFEIIPADAEVCTHAGMLRGIHQMKTPDAIHVATAVASRCDFLLTNDRGIRAPQGLEILILSQFA